MKKESKEMANGNRDSRRLKLRIGIIDGFLKRPNSSEDDRVAKT
jgi:hypothetical protein